ncbi:MAG: type II toxin-antitoxin system Phd/YefM family antitoxin [Armatimonadota bacterium]
MIDITEIRSLTEFVRHSKECVGKIKRKRSPMVLTVNGKAELVIQDAESYQTMIEKLNCVETLEAIKKGLEEAERGESRPASDVFAELSAKYGISR